MGHETYFYFKQTGRNLQQSWGTQLMTLFTVSMSILIFTFFFLVYTNIIKAGDRFGDELRLIVYLDDEVVPEMRPQIKKKITDYSPVEKIVFVSRDEAFHRLNVQLGQEGDVLNDLGAGFLPPSIEVFPKKDLKNLTLIKQFSDYLTTLPGAQKVQFGQGWVERFGYFTELLRVIVFLSGGLLVMATAFMVSYSIRLTVIEKEAELEVLRLVGARSSYIQTPLLIEGFLQGLLSSGIGLGMLYLIFLWTKTHLSGPGFLHLLDITFFPPVTTGIIMGMSILLCTGGSLVSIRKYLRI
ncbi:MAG: permease-like cell division protein FtsX [Proteobacteria bacterium]|nr:permease-like cell division protein FtsX [Pseudomonadota bacterium]MBU1714603.1 permease-like cell division protein FtsX [Pseudomonadota bacterium]